MGNAQRHPHLPVRTKQVETAEAGYGVPSLQTHRSSSTGVSAATVSTTLQHSTTQQQPQQTFQSLAPPSPVLRALSDPGGGGHLVAPASNNNNATNNNDNAYVMRFRGAAVSMQGWRPDMEDAHDMKLSIRLPGGIGPAAWLFLADGHGGKKVAQYASKNALTRLLFADFDSIASASSSLQNKAASSMNVLNHHLNHLNNNNNQSRTFSSLSIVNDASIAGPLTQCFIDLDAHIAQASATSTTTASTSNNYQGRASPAHHHHAPGGFDAMYVGATALATIITTNYYHVANAGDSRAILLRNYDASSHTTEGELHPHTINPVNSNNGGGGSGGNNDNNNNNNSKGGSGGEEVAGTSSVAGVVVATTASSTSTSSAPTRPAPPPLPAQKTSILHPTNEDDTDNNNSRSNDNSPAFVSVEDDLDDDDDDSSVSGPEEITNNNNKTVKQLHQNQSSAVSTIPQCRLTALPLSRDHKPNIPSESSRIFAAGSYVVPPNPSGGPHRVNGELAVARALGDFAYKGARQNGENGMNNKIDEAALKATSALRPPHEQAITCVPEVTTTARSILNDRFLVMACDGLWDVMKNKDVAEFIAEREERLINRCAIAATLAKGGTASSSSSASASQLSAGSQSANSYPGSSNGKITSVSAFTGLSTTSPTVGNSPPSITGNSGSNGGSSPSDVIGRSTSSMVGSVLRSFGKLSLSGGDNNNNNNNNSISRKNSANSSRHSSSPSSANNTFGSQSVNNGTTGASPSFGSHGSNSSSNNNQHHNNPQASISVEDIAAIASDLADAALERGSRDNITVMVIALPGAFSTLPVYAVSDNMDTLTAASSNNRRGKGGGSSSSRRANRSLLQLQGGMGTMTSHGSTLTSFFPRSHSPPQSVFSTTTSSSVPLLAPAPIVTSLVHTGATSTREGDDSSTDSHHHHHQQQNHHQHHEYHSHGTQLQTILEPASFSAESVTTAASSSSSSAAESSSSSLSSVTDSTSA